jgi:capsular polysaccharide biosynthesis protein
MPTERLSALATLRRHRLATAVVVLLAVAAGIVAGLVRPAVYTAEARVAVAGNTLSAQAVPGFALASQELAADYARYVNDAQEQSDLASRLGVRADTVEEVSASPIPDSSVVRIEVTALDAGTATRAAATVADALLRQVNDSASATDEAAATLAQYTDMADQVAAAQQAADAAEAAAANPAAGADLQQLRQAAAEAKSQLAILQVQQEALGQKYRSQVSSTTDEAAGLTLVQEAAVAGDDRLAHVQQFGLAGLVVGALLALLLARVLERRRSARVPAAADRGARGTDGGVARAAQRPVNGSAAVAGAGLD